MEFFKYSFVAFLLLVNFVCNSVAVKCYECTETVTLGNLIEGGCSKAIRQIVECPKTEPNCVKAHFSSKNTSFKCVIRDLEGRRVSCNNCLN